MKLTAGTYKRPDDMSALDDPRVLYARSYLLIRVVVGGIGFLLPTLLFLLDGAFLEGPVSIRGSLSAYYHTSARDLFVGALCIMGFFLITYMAGQKSTWDYWLSTVAGIAVLGVAFLPTKRPNLLDGAALCGSVGQLPPGCTQFQHAYGETQVAATHFVFAAIFILSLAVLCFVFGQRESRYRKDVARARFHRLCGAAILSAVAWVAVGGLLHIKVFGIEPLYGGEVVSVYSFGLSWLAKAQDLFKGMYNRIRS